MNLETIVLLNTVGLVIIAVINAFTAWQASRTRSDVQIIEKATNSMKDALVAATDVAARAEGKEAGRVQEVERAAKET